MAILSCASTQSSGALLLARAISLVGCEEAGALRSMPARELFAATNLTATERREHIHSLSWRVMALAEISKHNGTARPTMQQIDEVCECVVDQLQDRTTRLPFSIAMDTIKSAGFRREPDLTACRLIAMQRGMSREDFDLQVANCETF